MSEASDPTLEALRRHLDGAGGECVEWCPVCRGADLLRANATPEVREQWSALQREALLAVRTLIDHYLERVERDRPGREPRIEEIPVE